MDLRVQIGSFVLPLRFPLRAFGPWLPAGTAEGMLARARCDKSKHSRAAARLSIAVERRLQARTALPEAGKAAAQSAAAGDDLATGRLDDLDQVGGSASRQVARSDRGNRSREASFPKRAFRRKSPDLRRRRPGRVRRRMPVGDVCRKNSPRGGRVCPGPDGEEASAWPRGRASTLPR